MESKRIAIQEQIKAPKVGIRNKGQVQEEKPDTLNETNHTRDNPRTKNQNMNRFKRGSEIDHIGRLRWSYDDGLF